VSRSRASLAAVLLCAVAACTPWSPRNVPDPGRLAHSVGSPLMSPTQLAAPATPAPSLPAETAAGVSPHAGGSIQAFDPAPVVDPNAFDPHVFPAGDAADFPGASPGLDTDTEPGTEPTGAPMADPDTTVEPTATPRPTCPPAPAQIAPVDPVYHGSRIRREVAPTFDDGYNIAVTQRIVGTLQRLRVNATFFPTGLAVAAAPDLWRSVAAAGFPITNHTYAHRTLAGRCYQAQLSDLTRQRAVLEGLGIRSVPVMRPPGGAWDQTTRYAASGAGEDAIVLWDVDTRDWAGLSSGAIARRALAGHEGSIILLHTFPANTAAALPTIIAGYRARGFRFVTVGTMLGLGGSVPY